MFFLVDDQTNKTKKKGEVEDKLKTMGFEQLTIFQPGLLDRGEKNRFVESVGNFFVSGIKVKTVADAMIADAVHHFRETTKSTPIMVHNGNTTITNVAATDAGIIATKAAAAAAVNSSSSSSTSISSSTSSTTVAAAADEPTTETKKKKKKSSHSHSHSHGHSHSHSHDAHEDEEAADEEDKK